MEDKVYKLKMWLVSIVIISVLTVFSCYFYMEARQNEVDKELQLISSMREEIAGGDIETLAQLEEKISKLEEENDYLDQTLKDKRKVVTSLKKQIEEQEAQIAALEASQAAVQEPAQKSTSASSSNSGGSSSSDTSDTQSWTVYVTRTGSKYHKYGCQYLSQSCIPISYADATAKGYTACSRCW